ncbi:MAG: phosphoribosylaminoimidazolesuccinocarboxamide synthase [Candidatus Oxydemutatoraceae bacterium WSBS_2016_MAG_OTU14]
MSDLTYNINLPCKHRGKVRDLYDLTLSDGDYFLMVASDRLSAFDVVLPDLVPQKGEVLTTISRFWFDRTAPIISNHLSHHTFEELTSLCSPEDIQILSQRALIVQRVQPLPFEAIVRGYLAGSGWKDYQSNQSICGLKLPSGLKLAEKLPKPLFTPTSKAELGSHDQSVTFDEMEQTLGTELANKVRACSIALYEHACAYAETKGIIIADTKFEFGLNAKGDLLLIDEALTPDSSRFWDSKTYLCGQNPASFDKQFVRDYLETIAWNKAPPGPSLPQDIINQTQHKYFHIRDLLLGKA